MKLIAERDTILYGNRDYYHEVDRGSDTLVVTLGDSWTWGDRLGKTTLEYDDRDYRTSHIYGALISQQLDADFINIGFPGYDNFHILTTFLEIYATIKRSYKKCYVFFTLTESGRDLNYGLHNQKEHYNELRGKSWPTFDQIIKGTASSSAVDFARKEMIDNEMQFIAHFDLMMELVKAKSVNEFFINYEGWMFRIIKQKFDQLPSHVEWFVARNFASVRPENVSLLPVKNLTTVRWVDVIANNGSLTPYPDPVSVLSKMGLDPIIELSSILGLNKLKHEWLEVFEQSKKAMDWLEKSPYNSQHGTRHPLEQAHAWWAEFLLKRLK